MISVRLKYWISIAKSKIKFCFYYIFFFFRKLIMVQEPKVLTNKLKRSQTQTWITSLLVAHSVPVKFRHTPARLWPLSMFFWRSFHRSMCVAIGQIKQKCWQKTRIRKFSLLFWRILCTLWTFLSVINLSYHFYQEAFVYI